MRPLTYCVAILLLPILVPPAPAQDPAVPKMREFPKYNFRYTLPPGWAWGEIDLPRVIIMARHSDGATLTLSAAQVSGRTSIDDIGRADDQEFEGKHQIATRRFRRVDQVDGARAFCFGFDVPGKFSFAGWAFIQDGYQYQLQVNQLQVTTAGASPENRPDFSAIKDGFTFYTPPRAVKPDTRSWLERWAIWLTGAAMVVVGLVVLTQHAARSRRRMPRWVGTEDTRRIRAAFNGLRMRQIAAVMVALVGMIAGILFISDDWDYDRQRFLLKKWGITVGVGLAAWLFTLLHWRCPACGRYPGYTINPVFCPGCRARLQ